jgi:hypothetical protein
VISWIDPLIDWYQAELNVIIPESAQPQVLIGYLGNINQNFQLTNCDPALLGTPRPYPQLPSIAPARTFMAPLPTVGAPTVVSVFDSHQPPAKMGSLPFHDGANVAVAGSTLDIIPRNREFCIDNKRGIALVECDSLSGDRIPVRVPLGGGVSVSGFTIILDIDHQLPSNLPHRKIILTHLTAAGSGIVPAGTIMGYLCRHSEITTCGINIPDTPTHLAFDMYLQVPSTGAITRIPSAEVPTEILGFLSRPNCIYDDSAFRRPTPLQGYVSPYIGCR